jgi:hypothetical protein
MLHVRCRSLPASSPLTRAYSPIAPAVLRARARATRQVFTGDDVAEEYGVNKSSYEAVVLPNIRAYQARFVCACSMLYARAGTR